MELSERRRIRIIGAGPGAPEYLTAAGRQAANESDVLIGPQRLLDLVPEHRARVVAGPSVPASLAAIAACEPVQTVALLVSGDAGIFSLARFVVAQFGRAACLVVPGISALQVAFARVALDWSDARMVDAHGAEPKLPPAALRAEAKSAVFLGSASAVEWLGQLGAELRSTHAFVACSNLTLRDERVVRIEAQDLASLAARSRTVLLVLRKELWP